LNIGRLSARLFALSMNGELDSLMPPFGLLTETLARYPSGRRLETEEELQEFLMDDEAIRVALLMFVEMVADLDLLPADISNEPGIADLATNCREGALQWFADMRRFEAAHPQFKEELVRQSHLVSLATLEKLRTAPPAAPGVGRVDALALPTSGAAACSVCARGPATTTWQDMPVCAECKTQGDAFIAEQTGGTP